MGLCTLQSFHLQSFKGYITKISLVSERLRDLRIDLSFLVGNRLLLSFSLYHDQINGVQIKQCDNLEKKGAGRGT